MVKKFSILFIFILLVGFIVRTHSARADFDCLTLSTSSSPDQKTFCQNELDQLNQQLTDLTNQLANQKQQTGSFKSDIASLTKQIDALKVKIKARGLAIATLKVSITEKTATIETLQEKIDKEHQSLAQLLRNTNEFDNENMVNVVLSNQSISSFYSDLESYDSIKRGVKQSVDTINGVKTETEAQKEELQKQKDAQTDAKIQLENAQKQVAQTQAQKKQLLTLSQQKEADYKVVIADRQKRIADIKSRLFSLAGISQPIRFDVALKYAQDVSAKTNVDTAFLLAIITHESALGADVGSCYLTNSTTGEGVTKKGTYLKKLMHPTRDIPPFLQITNALGINAFKTPVSCPIVADGAYGGAMGPAQFIPSTWAGVADRVAELNGVSTPNPWDPKDAFTASAVFLARLGGTGDSSAAQSKAACRYYGSGGSTCAYSRNVMAKKATIQTDIDYINQYGVAKN